MTSPPPSHRPSSAPDAFGPVAGVDLELYAELSARFAWHGDDPATFARVAASYGVPARSWELADATWRTRMVDPTTAAQVAAAYLHLYAAALDRRRARAGRERS